MPLAKKFFTKQEQELLIKAIGEAEMNTSGEIRLHLENFCSGNEVKAAWKIFVRLDMHRTKERNGILIYIATMSRKIAVIGDEGIHQKLGDKFWEKLVLDLISHFKSDKRAEALAESIIECGKQLGHFFPRQNDDKNELSDSISY
ncbi:MAG: TPM domain-containing protein [bacterium]|nr:TPM domain-containing protein [bacterium]